MKIINTSILKTLVGYMLILLSTYISFQRGKNQGKLDCIDFNILPIIDNTITFIICITLTLIGLKLLNRITLKY